MDLFSPLVGGIITVLAVTNWTYMIKLERHEYEPASQREIEVAEFRQEWVTNGLFVTLEHVPYKKIVKVFGEYRVRETNVVDETATRIDIGVENGRPLFSIAYVRRGPAVQMKSEGWFGYGLNTDLESWRMGTSPHLVDTNWMPRWYFNKVTN